MIDAEAIHLSPFRYSSCCRAEQQKNHRKRMNHQTVKKSFGSHRTASYVQYVPADASQNDQLFIIKITVVDNSSLPPQQNNSNGSI